MIRTIRTIAAIVALAAAACAQSKDSQRWTEDMATAWYRPEPWLVGSNYIPAYAINELEMWQADTFDAKRIDKELGWAEKIGMNTMRVFLHDLLWQQDHIGFTRRIDTFLDICKKHKIRPIFVLFDSCWDPSPALGPQRAPKPGVHNSGWLQSPGAKALQDPAQYPRLRQYTTGVVAAFANDDRVLAWDIWNEPDNTNASSYGSQEPASKVELVLALLPKAFEWAREAHPRQPLTSGVWNGDWTDPEKMSPMTKLQLELSDVVSFHSYQVPADFTARIASLQKYGRPLLCTEYMARGVGSTFEGSLPAAKTFKVAAVNWGFVQGKTQTNMPWDSWQHPYVNQPPKVWFHDIFYRNGKPYRKAETDFIRKETGH